MWLVEEVRNILEPIHFGTYTFRTDENDTIPAGFTTEILGTEYEMGIIQKLDDHGKVLKILSTGADVGAHQSFTAKSTSGGFDIEFFIYSTGGTHNVFLRDGVGFSDTSKFWAFIQFNFTQGAILNYNPSLQVITSGLALNTWHHIRLRLIDSDTYQIWFDTVDKGQWNTYNTKSSIDNIKWNNPGVGTVYFDALDYSWETGWTLNRNLQNYWDLYGFDDDGNPIDPPDYNKVILEIDNIADVPTDSAAIFLKKDQLPRIENTTLEVDRNFHNIPIRLNEANMDDLQALFEAVKRMLMRVGPLILSSNKFRVLNFRNISDNREPRYEIDTMLEIYRYVIYDTQEF
jgi:hypothetical protein